MRYTVLVRRLTMGTYLAVAPGAPDCKAEGRTRDEALRRLKKSLEDWLAETEIVTMEVDPPESVDAREQNPWLLTAGIFADDPMLEPMLIQTYADRAAERPED